MIRQAKPDITVEHYERYIGRETVERLKHKAESLQNLHITNINSTYYGGGVSVLLSSLTILLNSLGIRTGWRLIQGSPDFFGVTKKMHNALQGGDFTLSERKKTVYESIIEENALRNHLDHDFVIIHDPQPLFMMQYYRKRGPWIWRCHIDLSNPAKELWNYFKPVVEKYDAVILSSEKYKQTLNTPQKIFMPAIDPFSTKNRELSDIEVAERLKRYDIPTDLPLIVQVSRFDRWKDPEGVIDAFERIRRQVPATLVLLGNVATDDPEGADVYQNLLNRRDERIRILSHEDTALVNALQRSAAVVFQKSIREGFGLTVAEAMWKGRPVIGGDVGGIRHQIENDVNGYLVGSVEEAADRAVMLLKDKVKAEQVGQNARESVSKDFLMTRLLEQYLDLFNGFETDFRVDSDQPVKELKS